MADAAQSRLDAMDAQQHLPAPWARPVSLGAATEQELSALPVFTGDGLAKSDPAKYRKVALLFFRAGLGVREISEIEQVSPQTVTAIVRRETGGQTADDWREHQLAELRALVSLSTRAASTCIADPEMLAAAGIKGIAGLLREAVASIERLEQRGGVGAEKSQTTAVPGAPQSDDVVAAAEHLRFLQARPIRVEEKEGAAPAPAGPLPSPAAAVDLALGDAAEGPAGVREGGKSGAVGDSESRGCRA